MFSRRRCAEVGDRYKRMNDGHGLINVPQGDWRSVGQGLSIFACVATKSLSNRVLTR